MRYCLQCGTVATNTEDKCENCDFTQFTQPAPDHRDARIAALETGVTKAIDEIKGLVYAVCVPMGLDDEELERKSERNATVIELRALLKS